MSDTSSDALGANSGHALMSLIGPEGELGGIELGDLIEPEALQRLMDDFYQLAHVPMSILDRRGRLLVGVGWQEICSSFHRQHPGTAAHCHESDTQLAAGLRQGECRLYRCKNSMWDIATPIVVGGETLGNIFSGQFFFADEAVDRELFRAQARKYGFDEQAYFDALDRVPHLSRETVDRGMAFFLQLADMLSQLGYSNLKLARLLGERDQLMASLQEIQKRLSRAQSMAHLGSWQLDLETNHLSWSDEVYRIFGLQPQEFAATYEAFLERIHPEDRAAVDAAYSGSLAKDLDTYEIEHRIVRKDSGEIRTVLERCEHVRDEAGQFVRSVGMVHDITESKRAEEAKAVAQMRQAAQEERSRLARDLHDSVTQALFAATLKAEALTLANDSLSSGTLRVVEDLGRLNRGALAQMRTLLLELRGDPLEEVPLAQLLRHLVEAAEARSSVAVQLTIRGEAQVPSALHAAIYRVAQEALNNATRHARASQAWVDLDMAPDKIGLVVGDDGCGFELSDFDPTHLGLRSMRERATEAGAHLDIVTEIGRGTRIVVEWQREWSVRCSPESEGAGTGARGRA